jgi:hypothetical protein
VSIVETIQLVPVIEFGLCWISPEDLICEQARKQIWNDLIPNHVRFLVKDRIALVFWLSAIAKLSTKCIYDQSAVQQDVCDLLGISLIDIVPLMLTSSMLSLEKQTPGTTSLLF